MKVNQSPGKESTSDKQSAPQPIGWTSWTKLLCRHNDKPLFIYPRVLKYLQKGYSSLAHVLLGKTERESAKSKNLSISQRFDTDNCKVALKQSLYP